MLRSKSSARTHCSTHAGERAHGSDRITRRRGLAHRIMPFARDFIFDLWEIMPCGR